MTLQDLYIYPVKSLGGIFLEKAKALQKGFEYDRRWMLVDENGKFITQRVEHQLALFQTELSETGISITYRADNSKILIPYSIYQTETISVNIWNDYVVANVISDEINAWFSTRLKKKCYLVFIPENGIRPVDSKYADHQEQVSFADAFPYLLIGQASLNDLNSRLQQAVPINRFRPNIVINTSQPFEEDNWSVIQIGQVRFKVAKPCARCILTTVDQQTGLSGKEPLLTLSKYRTINHKVLFGQNLIALNEGAIHINDEVQILEYHQH